MQVTLYKFTKRLNSTKLPTPSTGKNFQCELKDETSFLNPVLRFAPNTLSAGVFSPAIYNYALIPYWERFYYITDWNYINGVWECTLSVDVLASFREEIGNTSAYIIRSTTQYNGDILDSFYPTTTVCGITKQQISSDIYHKTIPGGAFVIGVINSANNANKMGAVIYYALTADQMKQLMNYLFSSNIYQASNISEIGEGLYKSLFDPFQYIVSCMWFPFAASTFGTGTDIITVGYWSTNITNAVVVNYVVSEFGFKSALPIAHHPQIARGAYLDHAPYTRLTAYYPPFGEIPIDTTFMQFGDNNYLYGKIYLDHVTGVGDCFLTITDGYDIDTTADPYRFMTMRTAQIGVPIQISQIMSDYVATISSGGAAIGSAFSGNISGIFSNITSAIESAMPKVSSLGANGSLVEIIEPPYLIVEHMQVVDENLYEFGRPLCNTRLINQLYGFVQCGEDDHQFSATKTESEEINRNLKNGFFYE